MTRALIASEGHQAARRWRSGSEKTTIFLACGMSARVQITSPAGTTRNVVGKILRESGLEPGRNFDLAYCPERVLPGNTVAELMNNDRILGGVTPQSAKRAQEMYQRFCQGRPRSSTIARLRCASSWKTPIAT
ncbi:MAG: hypothetical protein EXS16_07340 [Gemmataceae bacterium]|nr:hypothetical protein [Gemmataceae bacterium]